MEGINRKIAILALFMAVLTSFMVYMFLSRVSSPNVSNKTKLIYVAKVDIPAKTVVKAEMITQARVPVDITLPIGLSDAKQIIGKLTQERIIKGEAILLERLVSDQKASMAYAVPNGKRAVTIGVNEVAEVGNFIIPGDYVDVIATYDEKDKDFGTAKVIYQKYTKVVLQNVLVLGVGQNMGETKSEMKELPTSVTLAVSLDDAEKLVFSDENGVLRLALRPATDKGTQTTNGVIRDDVQNGKARVQISK